MSRPAVVATDLDGTIVRSDGTVSARTSEVLAALARAGVLVVFVTGRPPRWMHPVVEATGHRGLAVCANGALVYDLHAERVVAARLLPAAAARRVAELLRDRLPEVHFAAETADGYAHEPGYRPRWPVPPGTPELPLGELLAEPVAKLLVRHPTYSADRLLAAATGIVGELAVLTHSSSEGLLEIAAPGVSKASALAALVAEHGHTAADVLAFGDMPNDLPLLAWAGTAVAVANAHPSVLAAVREVTGSNDDDGVATYLARVFGLPETPAVA